MNIQWMGSPNYTVGRSGTAIDHIVIHWMDGNLASTDEVFQDKQRNTSAHYGVEDNTIHQYVKEVDTAYHSGDWQMNIRSIGIEHSAQPGRDASEMTYATSAQLIATICRQYRIPIDRSHIIKHSEVVSTQCPGTVDIDKIINMAKENEMPNDGDIDNIYLAINDRKATDQEKADYREKSWSDPSGIFYNKIVPDIRNLRKFLADKPQSSAIADPDAIALKNLIINIVKGK